jgi:hypothetical protein
MKYDKKEKWGATPLSNPAPTQNKHIYIYIWSLPMEPSILSHRHSESPHLVSVYLCFFFSKTFDFHFFILFFFRSVYFLALRYGKYINNNGSLLKLYKTAIFFMTLMMCSDQNFLWGNFSTMVQSENMLASTNQNLSSIHHHWGFWRTICFSLSFISFISSHHGQGRSSLIIPFRCLLQLHSSTALGSLCIKPVSVFLFVTIIAFNPKKKKKKSQPSANCVRFYIMYQMGSLHSQLFVCYQFDQVKVFNFWSMWLVHFRGN